MNFNIQEQFFYRQWPEHKTSKCIYQNSFIYSRGNSLFLSKAKKIISKPFQTELKFAYQAKTDLEHSRMEFKFPTKFAIFEATTVLTKTKTKTSFYTNKKLL